jgi:hypothetical protein
MNVRGLLQARDFRLSKCPFSPQKLRRSRLVFRKLWLY